MRTIFCFLIIFGLILPAGSILSATCQLIGMGVPDRVAIGSQAATSPMLSRFAKAIVASEDIDKIKNELFNSLIFELVRHDELAALESLAKRGEKFAFRDPDENTLLHIAASSGTERMVQFLIQQGLEVDADNRAGRSSLSLAVEGNRLGTAKLLLKSGANVNGNSQLGNPLATVASKGHFDMLTLLLDHRADINQRDADGNTPLHQAVRQGHYTTVERLLEYDADVKARNDAGQTPIALAETSLEMSKAGGAGLAKRKWGTEQVYGPPDAKNQDDPNAWASKSQDGQAEWLIVQFADSVVAARIEIYENCGPKAVNRITLFDSKNKEHEVWKGKDPAKPGENRVHVAHIKLNTKLKSNKFRIYLDSVAVADWNEIDAVRLTDKNGKQQWVKWAEASSCYASGDLPTEKYRMIRDLLVKHH